MVKRFSKSNLQLSDEEIANSLNYRKKGLRFLFSEQNPKYELEFVGYSKSEVNNELQKQIEEVEKDACLNILACIEAKFRLDYVLRCENRFKDSISQRFRELYAESQYRISFEDGILEEWKNYSKESKKYISIIKGAFKYRHWLAHGRYWTYKSTIYDFSSLYQLSNQIDSFLLK